MSGTDPAIPDPHVTALVKELEADGFESQHLDEAVQDAASERASAVNNGGLYEQVHFLLRGGDHSFKPHEIRFAARQAKEENDDASSSPAESDEALSPLEQWKARFRAESPGSAYDEALRRAGEPCDVIQTDETGDPVWAVVLEGGFWMEARSTRAEAEEFVQSVGWPLRSVTPNPHVDRRSEEPPGSESCEPT